MGYNMSHTRALLALGLVAALAGCGNPGPPRVTPTGTPTTVKARTLATTVVRDCAWSGKAKAWIDANANGVEDAGEPPLAGVAVIATEVGGFLSTGSSKKTTGTDGWIALYLGLTGCPMREIALYASAQPGYRPTTAESIRVPPSNSGPFLFGFAQE